MNRAPETGGKGSTFGKSIGIRGSLPIELGCRVAFRNRRKFGGNGKLRVSDRTSINVKCILAAVQRFDIVSDVMLASCVYALYFDRRFSRRFTLNSKEEYAVSLATIGDDVWICKRSVVTRGEIISDDEMIGANSLVKQDIPPYTIVTASPGRVTKGLPE